MDRHALDTLAITTLRMLAVDQVEGANSGHPGMPLGAAPMAHVLWTRFLRHHPANPAWPDRDRFILSAGHGSALLYGLLHLSGYDLPLEELRRFRQWGSRTPGHPEFGHTPGVEATTGPLGQGFAMGVGMAMAERRLAEQWNREGSTLVDHWTYAIVGDGDLMEGVSAEAASLAGHLGLGRIIYLYDANRISIEGSTDLAFTEDVAARFTAYGWQVLTVADGEALEAIAQAIRQAQADTARPSLIIVRTQIGRGSPMAGSEESHGAPLGAEGVQKTRAFYGWPDQSFHVPPEVRDFYREQVMVRGAALEAAWTRVLEERRGQQPQEAAAFVAQMAGELPPGWDEGLTALDFGAKPVATRAASGKALNALAAGLPALWGGSADLAPSNKTWLDREPGRNIHFGVREFAMAAACNGMALHGGIRPYCGTFLVFSDYMRGGIRLSALMGLPVVYVLTHDSIAVGEDGPTHQPIEHVASLRAMPGLLVFRPADARETAAAWHWAVQLGRPAVLALSRQNLPLLPPPGAAFGQGAYVVAGGEGRPDLILLASGSEVSLCLAAREKLAEEGVRVRVVSMPCWELFAEQPAALRDQVLPPEVAARLAVEAGASQGWHRWVGLQGDVIGVDRFGASAPEKEVMSRLGLTVEHVVARAKGLLPSRQG